MGGGTKTTTQTSENAPWAAAQPHLTGNMQMAQDLVNAGVGAQVNPFKSYVDFDDSTTTGLLNAKYYADQQLAGTPGTLTGDYRADIARGGFTEPQQGAMAQMQQGYDNLNPFASGENLGSQNPYRREAMQNAMADTQEAIDLNASGLGRYGSGSHDAVRARELGKIATDSYMRGFENDRNAMFGANQAQQGIAGNMFNAGQTAFNNRGAAFEGMMAPMDRMMDVGGMYENLEAAKLQDARDRFDQSQNALWNNLARGNAIAMGAGSLGGTQTARVQQPGWSPFMTGLGALSTLGGLWGGR